MMDAAKRTWTACWSSFFTHIATGMVLERSLILTVAVFVWPLSSARAQHDVSVLSHGAAAVVHVRPITPQLKKLVDTGYALSTTFRGVVDGLEGSSVIVHLVPDDALAPDLDGALQFVTTTPGFRYLRVFIRTDLESAVLIAVLAHELQHAAENRPDAVGGRRRILASSLSSDRRQILSGLTSRVLRHDIGPEHREVGLCRDPWCVESPTTPNTGPLGEDPRHRSVDGRMTARVPSTRSPSPMQICRSTCRISLPAV